jgi:hypothetical protein
LIARQSKFLALFAGAAFALTLAACNASTAHIGSLKVGTDKDVTTTAATFGPHDPVFAKGTADNIPHKVTMNWSLVAEKVTGQDPNTAIPSLNESFDLPSDGSTDYKLSPPPAGWPAGTYKIVLTMMDDGQQRDQKTAEFTIGG